VTHPGRGIRRGRKPGDALIDDRVRKAKSKARPNRQRFESLISALSPSSPPPVPALDALTLLALWRRFRMVGDVANAARILNELERLAVRPKRCTEGDRDEQHG
jgi:hypothetical protein